MKERRKSRALFDLFHSTPSTRRCWANVSLIPRRKEDAPLQAFRRAQSNLADQARHNRCRLPVTHERTANAAQGCEINEDELTSTYVDEERERTIPDGTSSIRTTYRFREERSLSRTDLSGA